MTFLVAILLLLATACWFLIARAPAMHEHFGRTDVGPLQVASAAADIRYFAQSFQQFVNARLVALRGDTQDEEPRVDTLPDGSGVWYASQSPRPKRVFERATAEQVTQGLVVIAECDLEVAAGVQVLKELYTSGRLDAVQDCVFRAVLTGGDVQMGPRCEVLRWVNASGALVVGKDSTLWGRASSSGTMMLAEGARFQRLGAPRIETVGPARARTVAARELRPMAPPRNVTVFASRWVVTGDLTIPPGHVVGVDLIVSGTLRVGRGSAIAGAVRCDVLLAGEEAVFTRSVIGESSLTFGTGCEVAGPVVAEGTTMIGDHSHVGSDEAQTTISAPLVKLGSGVVVCGEIWARHQGLVTPMAGSASTDIVAA
ncbi:MAG: hypothetical protein ABIY52_03535 [Gemmatimonadaceae bacterium]